ncbi:MAG: outer membrane beta-barrel protein [Bacteroidia bacterium]
MDNLLRDKFLSFEGDIPMSDWYAIEAKLDRKRRFAWIWWAALPLVIVAGLSLYSLLLNYKVETIAQPTILKKTTPTKESISKEQKSTKEKDLKSADTNPPNTFIIATTSKYLEKDHKKIKENHGSQNNISEQNTNSTLQLEPINLSSKQINSLWKYSFVLPTAFENNIAEKNLPKIKSPSIFSYEFGVNLAPAAGLDAIKGNKSNMLNQSYFSSIAGSSSLGTGFNQGIHAQINIGKHWFLRQGIYSSNYSVSHNYSYTIDSAPRITLGKGIYDYDPLDPSEIENIQYSGKATIKYLSLPIMVGYRTYIGQKMGFEGKIGFNASRLLSADGKTVNPTYLNLEPINSNNSIKKWNTGMSISAGWFYKSNNNLIFTVEPNFSTLLGSARNKDYPVKTRYYNYGINVNVNYILRKR